MGCNSSSSIEEIEFKKEIDKNSNSEKSDEDKNIDKKEENIIKEEKNSSEEEDSKENNKSKKEKEKQTKENSEIDKKNKYNKNEIESNKESKKEKNDKLKIKKFDNKNKNFTCALSTDDNKELSNINTEGINSENKKLNLHKQYYEGVTLMKGVEEYIPEELNEDDILNLVEDAIHGNRVEGEEKENDIAKITTEQAKAISKILYNKIHKKEVRMKDFPELKGLKVKIAVEKLTKDVIRKMMFNEKKVDDCQVDLTYLNLTKDNEDIRALTIELIP